MENTKIILDNATETNVNGIFYVFNSKYYFIYTMRELDENDYVRLYVVQVCKEVQNTPTGPIDTGYMLGMEINDSEEWARVQESITKIVEDKKNNTTNSDIQYLPISMLVNLKIIGKNKFKLMKSIVQDNFKIEIKSSEEAKIISSYLTPTQPSGSISSSVTNDSTLPLENLTTIHTTGNIPSTTNNGDVIIDYRSRFFEEQEKNRELEEQLKSLNQKLEQIKNIIG
ncbi:MAG: hypothetical protein IJE04_04830 [Bacilli bacterium]|nr:hypothetical protein [Bacilli bacterium]